MLRIGNQILTRSNHSVSKNAVQVHRRCEVDDACDRKGCQRGGYINGHTVSSAQRPLLGGSRRVSLPEYDITRVTRARVRATYSKRASRAQASSSANAS